MITDCAIGHLKPSSHPFETILLTMHFQNQSKLKLIQIATVVLCYLAATPVISYSDEPIKQCKDNPRYFFFQKRPTLLITCGEHYGSVINPQFDFETYLDTLAKDGLNYTRIFTGTYVEPVGAFGIERNTLAPGKDFLAPWARSETAGNADGGNRFDFDKWDDRYFDRLKRFLAAAEAKGIVVEVTLFCSTYADAQWAVHPFNSTNNNSSLNVSDWRKLHTLSDDPVNKIQKSVVQKIVREVNAFGNVLFEIQNEPWADRPVPVGSINPHVNPSQTPQWPNSIDIADDESIRWQRAVAGWITDVESTLPNKHLIAQNWSNFHDAPSSDGIAPNVSIINFHYAFPQAFFENRNIGKVIGCDETGFLGNADDVYRKQAWRFVMSGGALFNHLDYSFSVGHENGSDSQPNSPGGGSAKLRQQIGFMSTWFNRLEFARMDNDPTIVQSCPAGEALCYSEHNRAYAVYVDARKPTTCKLNLPRGLYNVSRMSAITGKLDNLPNVRHNGNAYSLEIDQDNLESAWFFRRTPFPAVPATQ